MFTEERADSFWGAGGVLRVGRFGSDMRFTGEATCQSTGARNEGGLEKRLTLKRKRNTLSS